MHLADGKIKKNRLRGAFMYRYKEKYVLDFRNVEYYLEFHAVIKKELDFPDYYGCNFDALWDCLTDMLGDPINVEIIGLENIARKFGDTAEKLLSTFELLKNFADGKYAHTITVTVIEDR